MLDTNRAYVITLTDAEGASAKFKYVAVGLSERDEQVPTATGAVSTKLIMYWVNSPNSPDRSIIAGEVRRAGELVLIEDLRPLFAGDKPMWWMWEPLTLESWKKMLPDIAGYDELSRVLTTDAELVNYYVQSFAPEDITDEF